MKIVLSIELVAWNEDPSIEGSSYSSVCITREFSLPFVPYPGMKIHLQSVDSNHPYSGRFSKVLKSKKVSVLPIFEIEDVKLSVSIDGNISSIIVTSTLEYDWIDYPKVEDRDDVISQMVYGYGFKYHRT